MSDSKLRSVSGSQVVRKNNVVAISTPIPGPDGTVSTKTPIFHLPVYEIKLKLDGDEQVNFHCDLADLTDLIEKLKGLENFWQKSGQISEPEVKST